MNLRGSVLLNGNVLPQPESTPRRPRIHPLHAVSRSECGASQTKRVRRSSFSEWQLYTQYQITTIYLAKDSDDILAVGTTISVADSRM